MPKVHLQPTYVIEKLSLDCQILPYDTDLGQMLKGRIICYDDCVFSSRRQLLLRNASLAQCCIYASICITMYNYV